MCNFSNNLSNFDDVAGRVFATLGLENEFKVSFFFFQRSALEIVSLLLEHGANPNVPGFLFLYNIPTPHRPSKIKYDLVSISSTFYEQLLHAQIPQAPKKKIDYLTVFFAFSGSASIKAAHRMLMKLNP